MTEHALKAFYDSVRWSIPCCPNCEHFSGSTSWLYARRKLVATHEHCTLDPEKRMPPAKVVAFGCPRFVQDTPF